MLTVDLKKQLRAIDLCLAAARKRQSPRTGFVHLFLADETASDTIPIYENFLFAFTLFRQKTAETVLEGKELLERLLAFQIENGQFPIYLHDFPRSWDPLLPLKIAPLFIHLLRMYSSILSADLKEKMEAALKKMVQYPFKKLSPLWEQRLAALQNSPIETVDFTFFSAQEWGEWIVTQQLLHPEQSLFPIPYQEELQVFLGPKEMQEKGEMKPSPIEWILAEGNFSPRLLKDHIQQLYLAPFFSFHSSQTFSGPSSWTQEGTLLWKGETLHSLSVPKGKRTETGWIFDLPEGIEFGREPLFESALYCDVSAETELYVERKKATVFRLGETVTIETPQKEIHLKFFLIEGEGDFCGHLFRGNRPNQTVGQKEYQAFDWQIALRTLRRSPRCKIEVQITQ